MMEYETRPHYHHHNHHPRHRPPSDSHHPSFSSSLLDAIYRSIDETDHDPSPTPLHRRKDRLTLHEDDFAKDIVKSKGGGNGEMYRRSSTVEKWSTAGITSKRNLIMRRDLSTGRSFVPGNSSGSSSDSSGFFSSESEFAGSRSSSSCYSMKRQKPIRTSISAEHVPTSEFRSFLQDRSGEEPRALVKIPRDGSNVVKARSTEKSNGDLKKTNRQPISPGGKLASFLNSIFNAKKARITVQSLPEPSDHSTCSSASSFSQSCQSVKTPPSTASSSSRRKSAEKRSVRFCPVSVILDEDCHPCGHKSLVEVSESRSNLTRRVAAERDLDVVMEENRRVAEAAREMLRNYQKRKESYDNGIEDGDEDDDDVASCASSDLFELDNLDRYREELPVYGTTSVGANLAIANGLMV